RRRGEKTHPPECGRPRAKKCCPEKAEQTEMSSFCVAVALTGLLGISAPLVVTAAPAQQTAGQTQGNSSTRVWVNTKSGVYHCPGTRYYGTTKSGVYMTEAEALKAGNRPAYGKYCG